MISRGIILKYLFLFCIQFLLVVPALARDCYLTSEIREMNPDFTKEPLYWNKDILRGFEIKIVKIPDSGELFYNLNYCSDGTTHTSGAEVTQFNNCEYISEVWLPVNRLEDPNQESPEVTAFFRNQVKAQIDIKVADLKLDPVFKTGLQGIHGLYFSLVGVTMYAFATVHKPHSRGGRFRRQLGRLTGVSLVGFTLWETFNGSKEVLSDEKNELRAELNQLVAQIDADAGLRLDGQDRDYHMSLEAMDEFVVALESAARITQEKFCSEALIQ